MKIEEFNLGAFLFNVPLSKTSSVMLQWSFLRIMSDMGEATALTELWLYKDKTEPKIA
jgi:hypothetical protein